MCVCVCVAGVAVIKEGRRPAERPPAIGGARASGRGRAAQPYRRMRPTAVNPLEGGENSLGLNFKILDV